MSLLDRLMPLIRRLDPERAHEATLRTLELGLVRPWPGRADPILASRVWGRDFANPVGLAAGFDKDARVPGAMLRLGFGFVEIGSVTPRPQPGNPRPRLFRLEEDRAVINRFGFNSEGLERVRQRLAARQAHGGIVGVNLGKNRDTADAAADYEAGAAALAPYAAYLVINVSSPNTAGLRGLQRRSDLAALVDRVREARDRAVPSRPPPLLVKIAPDLGPEERAELAAAALDSAVDGLVVSNTTVARPPELRSPQAPEPGGLSGWPLMAPSTELLREMRRLTHGRIVLVGVGGIASGADAYAKIRAGASLVQLYTGLVYGGPGLVRRIKAELAVALRRDGFAKLQEAVGADVRLGGPGPRERHGGERTAG